MRPLFLLTLLLILSASPARGQEDPGRTLSPYFVVLGKESEAELFPLKSTQVVANVNGVIAVVLVTQTYTNEGTEPINARYVFPASTRAAVHGMRIRVGDQVVTARIEERRKARVQFETAKAEGKSASLLEQQRPNVFTMNVANIMPRDRVEVELRYSELLIPTEGIYEFLYPTVVGPRYSSQREASATEATRWVKCPYLHPGGHNPGTFDIVVTLSAGMPLQDVRCASHPVDVAYDAGDVATVTLKDRTEVGGDRDFILNYRLAGEQIQSGLLLEKGETENFFLLMVQPPERFKAAEVSPREYVFILDVSGSMDGFPLETGKFLVADLIRHLRDTDLFNVVLFAGGSRVMADVSQPATEENVGRALQMIGEQRGGGGTELVPALKRALSLPRDEGFSRTIVVITDGFVDGDREVFEIIQENLSQTNFFSFGIGSAVNRHLVDGIARAGLGEPFVVTRPDEAREAAERFRAYVESPLLTDLRVVYRGLDAYEVEPSALPDLFAQRPLILFGKWRGSADGEIEVSGNGVAGRYSRTFRVAGSAPAVESGALRLLWARARIARLSDLAFGPVDSEVESQITALGLGYSLLTRYTSFVAVIEEARNTRGEAKDVDQPLPLPQGVSALAIGGAYESGAEPELWLLLALTGLVLALRRAVR
jgi:Ca-activated chloride channel family protein